MTRQATFSCNSDVNHVTISVNLSKKRGLKLDYANGTISGANGRQLENQNCMLNIAIIRQRVGFLCSFSLIQIKLIVF